jgi:ABC-type transport system substrate-binding protein
MKAGGDTLNERVQTQAVISRRTALQLGAGSAIGLAAAMQMRPSLAAVAKQDATPKTGGTLRFGAVRDATVFDPHLSGGISNNWLIGNIYDKLIDFGPGGEFIGVLAESWEQTDPLNYTFKLRQGVTFQKGQTFTSRDVLATFERIGNPELQAANADAAANIASISAPDDFTVNITLTELDLGFLHAIGGDSFFILSADDVATTFESPDVYNGTGPFTLEGWEPRSHFNLVRNPTFWRPGQPYVDRVELRIVLEDATRVNDLLSGEADLIEYVPWESFEVIESAGAKLYPSFGLQSYLRLNQSQEPLTTPAFRRALSYIINRDEVNDLAFGGKGKPMYGSLQPESSQYYQPEFDGHTAQNLELATQLIQEAGYASVADVPTIDFQVSTSALAQQPAQVIQQQLQDFGLKVEFRTVDVATLIENRANGTYVLHMDGGGMAWPDPDYLRSHFHSVDGVSHAVGVGYSNPELDALLEEGARTADVEARKAIYKQVEQIILDDCPMIFVLWRAQAEAAAEYVRGFEALPDGLQSYRVDHFENLWLDQ